MKRKMHAKTMAIVLATTTALQVTGVSSQLLNGVSFATANAAEVNNTTYTKIVTVTNAAGDVVTTTAQVRATLPVSVESEADLASKVTLNNNIELKLDITTSQSVTLIPTAGYIRWNPNSDGTKLNVEAHAGEFVTSDGTSYNVLGLYDETFEVPVVRNTTTNGGVTTPAAIRIGNDDANTYLTATVIDNNGNDYITTSSSIQYEWYRNDVLLPGQTTNTYLITDADRGQNIKVVAIVEGKRIEVLVTLAPAQNPNPNPTEVEVNADNVTYTRLVSVTDTLGNIVTTTAQVVATMPISVESEAELGNIISLQNNVKLIVETANGQSLVLTPTWGYINWIPSSDGSKLTLTARAGDFVATDGTVYSVQGLYDATYEVPIVRRSVPNPTQDVKVPSAIRIGNDDANTYLTATVIDNNGDEYITTSSSVQYEWYRNDVLLPGQTTNTYLITDADRGQNIRSVAIVEGRRLEVLVTLAPAINPNPNPTEVRVNADNVTYTRLVTVKDTLGNIVTTTAQVVATMPISVESEAELGNIISLQNNVKLIVETANGQSLVLTPTWGYIRWVPSPDGTRLILTARAGEFMAADGTLYNVQGLYDDIYEVPIIRRSVPNPVPTQEVKVPYAIRIGNDDANTYLTATVIDNDGNEYITTSSSVQYEWYRNDVLLPGEVSNKYLISDIDRGQNIKAVVIVEGKRLEVLVTLAPPKTTTPITNPIPVEEVKMPAAVLIKGSEAVGKTLTAQLLTESAADFTGTIDAQYEWYRLSSKDEKIENGQLVGQGETYKLVSDDKGEYIKLVAKYNGKVFEDTTSKIQKKSSSSSSSSSSSGSSSSSISSSSSTSTNSSTSSNTASTSSTANTSAGSNLENSSLAATGTSTATLSKTADGNLKLVDNNGQPAQGWQQVNGSWYLANATGTAQTGWQQVNGAWYLLKNDGVMTTGWQAVNNKWYLLDSSGAMKTGWQQVNGSWYYLYSDGSMASNTTVDGYTVDSSGAWV